MSEVCPVCNEEINSPSLIKSDIYSIHCPRCGSYKLTGSSLATLRNTEITLRQRANVSGWLRENQGYEINTYNWKNLTSISTPGFHERANKLLLALEKGTEYAGQFIERDPSWISYAWCINGSEFKEVLIYLVDEQKQVAISKKDKLAVPKYKITATGWAKLDKLKSIGADSLQGFVAMWFDDSMQEIYDTIISEAIIDSGYRPHRVDQREHNDKIDDEIISQIKRSRFVLADFTGHRGGVYFEAGFAKGLGLEVIWTCREDDIQELHFDIRQYNCIIWSNDKLDEFRKKINFRIESVLGQGTYKNVE